MGVLKIATTRFGEIEVEDAKVITFPEGLVGFSDNKKFVLINHKDDSPFKWLQSVDEAPLAFLVSDPFWFCPDYEFELTDEDEKMLEIASPEQVAVLVTITIPKDNPQALTANMLGPLVFNSERQYAKQLVLTSDKYTVQYPVIKEYAAHARPVPEAQAELSHR